MTTRVALDHLRSARRRREVPLEGAREPSTASAEPAVAQRSELEGALQKLPVALRAVFVLKEIDGQSHAEIARTLGIRVGTSEVRLHRAVAKLRRYLEEGW